MCTYNQIFCSLHLLRRASSHLSNNKSLGPMSCKLSLQGLSIRIGQQVSCLCDNAAVIVAVNKGSARDPALSHLLWLLAFASAVLDIYIKACHFPGVLNRSADILSRNRVQLFFHLTPQASPILAIIPPELRELVINKELSLTSLTRWHCGAWKAALHLPPSRCTNQPRGATHSSV